MNERITELAEQAGLELSTVLKDCVTPVKSITIEQRKFAKLIVKECAKLCYDRAYKGTLGSVTDGAMLCANDIKEHFGVEE